MRLCLVIFISLFATITLWARPNRPLQAEQTVEYLVVWRDTTNIEKQKKSLSSLNNHHGLKRSRRAASRGRRNIESFVFKHQHNKDSVINAYMATGLFEVVEVAPVFTPHAIPISITPNDPLFPDQWYLKSAAMNMDSTWFITTGSDSVVIAIIDAGFSTTHPEISSRLWVNPNANNETSGFIGDVHGWNFVENNHNLDANPASSWSSANHGALVSSSMGALGSNNLGFAGATWKNPLMLLRIWDDTGATSAAALIDAIEYAVRNGAKIINMSFGSRTNSQIIENVINDAHRAGVMMFASSGNFGDSTIYYPAGYENVFAIGAHDQSGQRAPFSNYGSHIDFLTPGTSITAINSANVSQFLKASGTSFSSALASASAGLILSINPNLTRSELLEIFKIGCLDLRGNPQEDVGGLDRFHGWGNLNAYKAVRHTKKIFNSPPTITNSTAHININTSTPFSIGITTSDIDGDSVYLELATVSDVFTLQNDTLKRTNFDIWGNQLVNIIAHDIWDTIKVSFSFSINSPPFFTSPLSIRKDGFVFDTMTTMFSIADSNDARPKITFETKTPIDYFFVNDTVVARWVFRDTGQFVSQISLLDTSNEASRETLQINFFIANEPYTFILNNLRTKNDNYSIKLAPNPFHGSGHFLIQSKKSGYHTINLYNIGGSRIKSAKFHLAKGENTIPFSFELNESQIVLIQLINNTLKSAKSYFYYIVN